MQSNEKKLAENRASSNSTVAVSDKVFFKGNNKKTPSLWWTDALAKVCVEAMVEEAQISTTDGGFKSQSWSKLVTCVTTGAANELVKLGVKEATKAQLQSKYAELKKKHSVLSPIGW